jgi:hypothetical protein
MAIQRIRIFGGQMMKYKVGDKIKFVKDCALSDGNVIHAKTVWVVREVEEDCYLIECVGKHLAVIIEHGFADDSFEKVNEAPSITKRINDKHNILNGLTKTDTLKPNYYQYRGGDVFDMAAHFQLNFPLGNALKYLLRAGHKDPAKKVEDLNKCIECIKRHIELEG